MSSDSISSYDGSASRYSVAPTLQQKRRNESVRECGHSSSDTIESPKESVDQVKSLPKSVAGEKAVKIARAGRFVIYVLALPPFLLLYTLPKIVFLNFFPLMAAPMEKGVIYGKVLLQKILQWIGGRPSQLFRNRSGRIDWAKKGVEKFFFAVRERGFRLFRQFSEWSYRPLQRLYFKTAREVERLYSSVRARFRALEERCREAGRRVGAAAAEKFFALYSTTLQPIFGFIALFSGRISEWGGELFRYSRQVMKRASSPIARLAAGVRKVFVRGGERAARAVAVVLERLLAPYYFSKRVRAAVERRAAALKEALIRQLMRPFRLVASHVSARLATMRWRGLAKKFSGFKRALGQLLPFIEPLERESREILDRWISALRRLLLAIFALFSRICHRLLGWSFPLLWRVAHFCRFFMRELSIVAGVQCSTLAKVGRPFLHWMAKGSKFFALLAIAAGLVVKYWVAMLFELSDEIVNRPKQRR